MQKWPVIIPNSEADEWKLILMGGVLGVAIGLVQAFGINS